MTGDRKLVEFLLKSKAIDVNMDNGVLKGKLTPLMYAAYLKDEEMVRLLMQYGADPIAKDVVGHQAIDYLTMGSFRSKYLDGRIAQAEKEKAKAHVKSWTRKQDQALEAKRKQQAKEEAENRKREEARRKEEERAAREAEEARKKRKAEEDAREKAKNDLHKAFEQIKNKKAKSKQQTSRRSYGNGRSVDDVLGALAKAEKTRAPKRGARTA